MLEGATVGDSTVGIDLAINDPDTNFFNSAVQMSGSR